MSTVTQAQSETSLTLALLSHDGDEGYPGRLLARVTYSLPSPTQVIMTRQILGADEMFGDDVWLVSEDEAIKTRQRAMLTS